MPDERTTWYEPSTKLTHAVTVFGVDPAESEGLIAWKIRTDCGIELAKLDDRRDRPVTCQLCKDSDWLNATLAGLETAADRREEVGAGS